MCSCDRDQLDHLHNLGGGCLHLLSEVGIGAFYLFSEGNHGKCRHRTADYEEYKDGAASHACNCECNNKVQHNGKDVGKELLGESLDGLDIPHNLGLQASGLHFLVVGDR